MKKKLDTDNFARSIYQEHLDETWFLYNQRLALLEDTNSGWAEPEAFENRLEAHVAGLSMGGQRALEVCEQALSDGEDGILHAAVRVMCRMGDFAGVRRVLENLDAGRTGQVKAAVDALVEEMPPENGRNWIQNLVPDSEHILPVMVTLGAVTRTGSPEDMAALLRQENDAHWNLFAWAAGRLANDKSARPLLIPHLLSMLERGSSAIQEQAALALLRMGHIEVISILREQVAKQRWPSLFLGLSGSAADARYPMNVAASEPVAVEALEGLGLLGDTAAIDLLIERLEEPVLSEAAAMALEMITGAGLREQVAVPESIDPDELFDDELQKLQNGEAPYPEDTFATRINRICRSAALWREWWLKNKSGFSLQTRYRNGKPYSPMVLWESLQFPQTPHKVRRWACEELMIRYNIDVGFEPDMFVARQKKALAGSFEFDTSLGPGVYRA